MANKNFRVKHGLEIGNNSTTHATINATAFNFTGLTTLTGNVAVASGNVSVGGITTLTGNLAVNGTTTLTGLTTHTGNATFSGNVGIGNTAPVVKLHITSTDAVWLTAGNTAQRPTGANGMFRYNAELAQFEGFANSAWGEIGGAAGGGYYKGNAGTVGDAANANNLYRINANTQSANVTIAAGENASVTGPISISNGFSLTISSGGRAVIH